MTMAALAGVMILMVFAPVLVRILERHRMTVIARGLAYTGYLWMALLFLFVSATLLIDSTRMLLWGVGKVFDHDPSCSPSDITAEFLSIPDYLAGDHGSRVLGCPEYTVGVHHHPDDQTTRPGSSDSPLSRSRTSTSG